MRTSSGSVASESRAGDGSVEEGTEVSGHASNLEASKTEASTSRRQLVEESQMQPAWSARDMRRKVALT